MKRECAPPLKERLRKPMALAAIIGALAVPPALASHESVPPLKNVGYNTNEVWNTDLEAAEDAAKRAKESGATEVRIFHPFTNGGKDIMHDVDRTCNAAKAAYDNGLELMITIEGHYRDGEVGFMPTRASEERQYVTTVSDLMGKLADDNAGCLPEQKNLTIGFFNEPNNKTFDRNQYIGDRWASPGDTVSLMAYAYPKLHEIAARPNLNINLRLVGGDLSSGISSRAIDFINEMGAYVKQKKIKGPIMDEFAMHFYVNGSGSDADERASRNLAKTKAALKHNFGKTELIYDEVGAFSDTPSDKEGLYNIQVPPKIKPLPGDGQGEFYSWFVQQAACEGVKSVLIFHETDDPNDYLRTGDRYPNGTLKSGANILIKAFQDAKDGNLTC